MDVRFVLVRPEDPHNIGAVARVLHNLGFPESLVIVGRKRSEWDCLPARYMAHNCEQVLASATEYDDLVSAVSGCDVTIGTSTRHRKGIQRYHPVTNLTASIVEKSGGLGKVAIVFGPESTGLPSAELELCDLVSTIPMAAPQPSFNLAQAVLIYAYELTRNQHLPLSDRRFSRCDIPVAPVQRELAHLMLALNSGEELNRSARQLIDDLLLVPGKHLRTINKYIALLRKRILADAPHLPGLDEEQQIRDHSH